MLKGVIKGYPWINVDKSDKDEVHLDEGAGKVLITSTGSHLTILS